MLKELELLGLLSLVEESNSYKLAQLPSFGEFSVYKVDGSIIRRDKEPNFTNYAQHYQFPDLIPENEFWVDKDDTKELPFYLLHMFHEHGLMRDGATYDEAIEQADKIEKREREKSTRYQQYVDAKDDLPIKLEKLGTSGPVTIWLVDGELVRDFYDTNFTEGGHNKAYTWIPENEVWIDNSVGDDEIEPVILHELFELGKMLSDGLSYEQAHLAALEVEQIYRYKRGQNG